MLEKIEADLDNVMENNYAPNEEIPEVGSVALAGKNSKETITAADAVIDAIDIAEAESKQLAEHEEEKIKESVAEFMPNTLMIRLSPSDYVLRALSNVRTNDLEHTLLVCFGMQ